MTTENMASSSAVQPRWRPLGAVDRRVAGVLIEKAKTTPDAYPMSLNAVCTACNQKSNRFPIMALEPDDVEQSLDQLREIGAVGIIEGYGRVAKYRHYLYEWLGVEKVELAVMGELLLRGAQTVGELRGRAARMEPIADLAALQPVLASLKAKGLVIPLTPEGRGHVVTHALYTRPELERLRAEYAAAAAGPHVGDDAEGGGMARAASPPAQGAALADKQQVSAHAGQSPGASGAEIIGILRRDVDELRSQLKQLRSDLDEFLAGQRRMDQDLRDLKDALGG